MPTGKKAGQYQGRVAVRASGSLNIQTANGLVQGISYRHCTLIQRGDGYGYTLKPTIASDKGEREQGRDPHAARSLPGLKAGVSRATG